jgi:polyisoprenoid-binding protein YceI
LLGKKFGKSMKERRSIMRRTLWNKTTGSLPILLLIVACATSQAPAKGRGLEIYEVDPVHSSTIFRVKHLGITYVYGRFNNLAGTLKIDNENPANNSVDMHVRTEDVDTFNVKRDDHLRSPDFFDAGQFPVISFKSSSFRKLGRDEYEVRGDLNVHGVTRPLKVKALHTGEGTHPSGDYRIGFQTTFTIMRTEFGMDYFLGGVSDEVVITLSVQGIRK